MRAEAALDQLGDAQPQDLKAEAALAIAKAAKPQSPIGIIDSASSLAIGQSVMIRPKGETADLMLLAGFAIAMAYAFRLTIATNRLVILQYIFRLSVMS